MRLQSQLSVTLANVKNNSFPLPYEVPQIGRGAAGRPTLDMARLGSTRSAAGGPCRGRGSWARGRPGSAVAGGHSRTQPNTGPPLGAAERLHPGWPNTR